MKGSQMRGYPFVNTAAYEHYYSLTKKVTGLNGPSTLTQKLTEYFQSAIKIPKWGSNEKNNQNRYYSIFAVLESLKITSIADIGAGSGLELDFVAGKLGVSISNVLAVDIKNYLKTDSKLPFMLMNDYYDFPTIETDMLMFFMSLHHQPYWRTLLVESISKMTSPNAVIVIRDHQVTTPLDTELADFEHFVYELGTNSIFSLWDIDLNKPPVDLCQRITKAWENYPMLNSYFSMNSVIDIFEKAGWEILLKRVFTESGQKTFSLIARKAAVGSNSGEEALSSSIHVLSPSDLIKTPLYEVSVKKSEAQANFLNRQNKLHGVDNTLINELVSEEKPESKKEEKKSKSSNSSRSERRAKRGKQLRVKKNNQKNSCAQAKTKHNSSKAQASSQSVGKKGKVVKKQKFNPSISSSSSSSTSLSSSSSASSSSSDDSSEDIPDNYSIADWARDKPIIIPNLKRVREYLSDLGLDYIVDKKRTGNAHPISACMREVALMGFFRRIGRDKNSVSILDWYGSMRNKLYKPERKLKLEIKFNCCPTLPIAGDNARGFVRDGIAGGNDVFLIQDVYQSGCDSTKTITPETLLLLCDLVESGTGYLIMREFDGWCGTDSDRYSEGLWYKESEDLVVFSPDPCSKPYHPHPHPSWLYKYRNYKGLDIADIAHYGPYTLFCVQRTSDYAVLLNPPAETQPLFDMVEVKKLTSLGESLYNWTGYNSSFLSYSEKLLVYKPTFNDKNFMYNVKTLSGSLIDSVRTGVLNDFRNNALMSQLAVRFNNFYRKILNNTCYAIIMASREEQSMCLSSDVDKYQASELRLIGARTGKKKIDNTVQEYYVTFFAVVFGSISLYCFRLRLLKLLPYSNLFVGSSSCLVAAVSVLDTGLLFATKIVDTLDCILQPLSAIYKVVDTKIIEIFQKTYDTLPHHVEGFTEQFEKLGGSENLKWGMRVQMWESILWAPTFEEFLREFFPKSSFCFNHLYESYTKYGGGRIGWQRLIALNLLFHSLMFLLKKMGVTWLQRTVIHTVWNLTATIYSSEIATFLGVPIGFQPQLTASAGLLSSCYYSWFPNVLLTHIVSSRKDFVPIELAQGIYSLPISASFPSTVAPEYSYVLKESVQKTLITKWNGIEVSPSELLEQARSYSDHVYVDKKCVYPIISPINLMHRPSTCPTNLICAAFKRTFNDPYVDVVGFDPDRVYQNWNDIVDERMEIYKIPYIKRFTFEAAIENMDNVKKKRLRQARNDVNTNGSKDFTSKSISVKHDELIAVKYDINGVPSFKPRAIVQFAPHYLALQTQASHTLTEILHELYNKDECYVVKDYCKLERNVSYVFASGYTAEQLNSLMDFVLLNKDRVFFIVAGDDSYVSWGPLAHIYGNFTEFDFSMYDHTQGEGPMDGDSRRMQTMNVPTEVIDRKRWGASSKFHIYCMFGKETTLKVVADAEDGMPSGDGFTTYGNSDHNTDFGHNLVKNAGSGRSFSDVALDLGFIVKSRNFDFHDQGTFLKGWWTTLSEGQNFWLPLPSMVLKLGKVMKDPCFIAKNDDPELAYKLCLYALARSPGVIPFNYPILGPFVQKMLELGVESDLKLEHRFKKIKIPYTDSDINLDFIYSAIYLRYSITIEEIHSFSLLISKVQKLPCSGQSFNIRKINDRLFVMCLLRGRHITIIYLSFNMSTKQHSKKPRQNKKQTKAKFQKRRDRISVPPNPVSTRRILRAGRLASGQTNVNVPANARFVGFGDYTEQKGRALYDKRKTKKAVRASSPKNSWWDTLTGLVERAGPLLGKAAIGALTGFGDYEIGTNSMSAAATGGKIGGDIPLMTNSHCANIMHHREYIGPVNGSTDPFKIQSVLDINPGLSATFPWLSPIAACYTRYRLRGAVLIYEPLASDFTTAGSLGFVAIGSQYNSLDAPFTSKREMLNHEFSNCEKPSLTIVHPLECAPNQMSIDEYYIREKAPPANADIRFYDLCKTTIATGGNPVDTQVGDLWMSFEVEFYQPKISTSPDHNDSAAALFYVTEGNATPQHPMGIDETFNTLHHVKKTSGIPTVWHLSGTEGTDTLILPDAVPGEVYNFSFTSTEGSAGVIYYVRFIVDPFDPDQAERNWVFGRSPTGYASNSYFETVSFLVKTPSPRFSISTMGNALPISGENVDVQLLIQRMPNLFMPFSPTKKFSTPELRISYEEDDEISEEELVERVISSLIDQKLLTTPGQRAESDRKLLDQINEMLMKSLSNNNSSSLREEKCTSLRG